MKLFILLLLVSCHKFDDKKPTDPDIISGGVHRIYDEENGVVCYIANGISCLRNN